MIIFISITLSLLIQYVKSKYNKNNVFCIILLSDFYVTRLPSIHLIWYGPPEILQDHQISRAGGPVVHCPDYLPVTTSPDDTFYSDFLLCSDLFSEDGVKIFQCIHNRL